VNRFFKYFDIRPPRTTEKDRLALGEKEEPRARAWPQWLALFAGIMIQPYFEGFRRNHTWQFAGWVGWAVFAVITSVIIFPAVYRKVVDAESPILLQLAPIFASGLGWESLFGTVMGAVTGKPVQ